MPYTTELKGIYYFITTVFDCYDKQSESMKYYYKAMVWYEYINTVEMYRILRRTSSGKLYNERKQLSMGRVLSRVWVQERDDRCYVILLEGIDLVQ